MQIIFHIGLPKTGTTFLQKYVFPYFKDVYFSGVCSPNRYSDCFKEFNSIDSGLNITEKKEEINQFIKTLDKNFILYSHETLCGKPIELFQSSRQNAKVLNELFPDAKIFFVFRKQDNWIQSYYNETFIKKNAPIRLKKFLNAYNLHRETILDWTRIYADFAGEFGEENILALPYEMFSEDQESFLNKFYNFTGISAYFPENSIYENKSPEMENKKNSSMISSIYTQTVQIVPDWLIRKIRIFTPQIIKLLSVLNVKVDYSAEILNSDEKEQILKLYVDSNKKLSALTGIDLSKYGYY